MQQLHRATRPLPRHHTSQKNPVTPSILLKAHQRRVFKHPGSFGLQQRRTLICSSQPEGAAAAAGEAAAAEVAAEVAANGSPPKSGLDPTSSGIAQVAITPSNDVSQADEAAGSHPVSDDAAPTSPLLATAGADESAAASTATANSSHASSKGERSNRSNTKALQYLISRDLKRVWTLAIPLIFNNLAGYALSIVGAIFIGQLGALPLSASVLANSVYNCTGLSLALGLSAGMETLCGQAYGAGAYKRVGIVLQRALLVCWTVCLPVCLLWLNSHSLLLQLGQQPDIAALASRYLIFCIPCLFLTTAMECIRKYLQSQRAVKPAMGVAAVTLGASPLFFWFFMVKAQMGLDGAALAFITCQVATLVGLLGCVVWRAWRMQGKREQTWGGWSGEAFKEWGDYFHYGLPAAAMIALEWWAYEVILILAGLLPNAEVALSTMGICLNINAWMYMLPLGLGAAVNTSISNAMGAGHADTAKRAFLGGIASGALMQACLCASIVTQGKQLVQLFTNDAAVVASCCSVLPLLAGLVFFDGINAVVSGVLRGSGRQMLGASINAVGYWVIGVPLAAYLAFSGGMGLQGFWIGVASGACVQAVVLLSMLFRWDWKAEVARVQRLLAEAAESGKVMPSYGH